MAFTPDQGPTGIAAYQGPTGHTQRAGSNHLTSLETCTSLLHVLMHLQGDIQGLQWLLSQSCPYNCSACAAAAAAGQFGTLQCLRQLDPPCPWEADTCSAAAGQGHLDVINWLRSGPDPCPCNATAMVAAAGAGKLEVLQWLCHNDDQLPFHLYLPEAAGKSLGSDALCTAAAAGGQLQILQWLRSQKPSCSWSHWTTRAASAEGG